jgi:hypothetical protein
MKCIKATGTPLTVFNPVNRAFGKSHWHPSRLRELALVLSVNSLSLDGQGSKIVPFPFFILHISTP